MRAIWKIMLVLMLAVIAGRAVAMLPPETFKDPIFASQDSHGSDSGGGETTDFA